MAGFSVVALVREEATVLRRFVDHYRRLGAERIMLFHDGPIGHLAAAGFEPAALAREGVALEACDAAFWERETGAVPGHVQTRLRAAFALGHRRCESDWLLVCDADEFVIDRMPVADLLDAVPAGIDSVGLAPAEAVWGPGDDIDIPFGATWFRRAMPQASAHARMALAVYGPLGLLFRQGLLSHTGGKQFLRRGARFDLIHQHYAVRGGARVTVPAAAIDPGLGAVELAHFDAVGYARWHEKYRRRAADPPAAMRERARRQRAQVHLFAAADRLGAGATRALFRGLYALDARQIARLERAGLVFRADLFG